LEQPEFLCECECSGRVELTPQEYDLIGGAWIEGASPQPASDAAGADYASDLKVLTFQAGY